MDLFRLSRRLEIVFIGWTLILAVPSLGRAAEKALTWDDCVHEAALRNPDIIAAQQNAIKAKNLVSASRSDWFPVVNGQASYEASNSASNSNINPDNPLEVDIGTRNQFTLGASLDQNVFAGFKTTNSVKRSRASYDDAVANLALVKSQVSADLKTAFARLLFFQKQIDVAEKIVERREENVRFVRLRFEGGRENKGNVMRNQALYEQAKFDLAETERQLKVARRELARALGRDYSQPTQEIEVAGSFKTNFPKHPPELPAITVQHPEHEQLGAQIRVAESDVKLAKGDLYPSVDATASIVRRKFLDSNANNLWSAGVNLNYPFFTGGRDIYEVRAARADQWRATEVLHSTDNRLTSDLKSAYTDFKDALENIKVQEGFLEAAQVRAQIARAQYANGLISFNDWDIIENDLINNERTILESQRDALIAEANWERAQGKGAIP